MRHVIALSWEIARKQLKLANEGSYLGVLWFFISPLFMFLLLLFVYVSVFSPFVGNHIKYYTLYVLLGIIIYDFFRGVTSEATGLVYGNRHLIKSIKFPYVSLVGASIIRIFFSSFIEVGIFAVIMSYHSLPITHLIWYPVVFALLFLFVLGVALFLAAVTIFFLDLQGLWGALVHTLWFATPILYSTDLHQGLLLFNFFNPLYYYIVSARELIIYATFPQGWLWLGMIGFAAISLSIGAVVYSRLESQFAEKC